MVCALSILSKTHAVLEPLITLYSSLRYRLLDIMECLNIFEPEDAASHLYPYTNNPVEDFGDLVIPVEQQCDPLRYLKMEVMP